MFTNHTSTISKTTITKGFESAAFLRVIILNSENEKAVMRTPIAKDVNAFTSFG